LTTASSIASAKLSPRFGRHGIRPAPSAHTSDPAAGGPKGFQLPGVDQFPVPAIQLYVVIIKSSENHLCASHGNTICDCSIGYEVRPLNVPTALR
jgi:hypothetical protein